MYATIQRWGNSNGIRIPKALLESIGLFENDRVELTQSGNVITIKKAAPLHKSLEERLTAFYGKPLDEIGPIPSEPELDWGGAVGEEAW